MIYTKLIVTMKKTKMYVTDFIKKGKILIVLNSFTLNFTDFLCQKFNLRKKIV